MNFKTTVFLLALLLIVGGYFLLVEYGREATPYEATARDTGEGQPLFTADALPAERVQTLTIAGESSRVVFDHTDGEWRQVEPVRFPMNTWSMRNLIDETARLRYSERFEPGRRNAPSLEDTGLAEPLATVTLHIEGGGIQTLRLGRKTIGGRGYAMLNDDTSVYVINDKLHRELLDKKISELRQKALSAPSEGQADWLRLQRNGDAVEVAKHDGQWALGGDHRGRVAAAAVRDILAGVNATWVRRFVADQPDDLAQYGLDRPAIELHIRQTPDAGDDSAQGKATVLRVGAPVDLQRNEFFATITESDEPASVVFTINRSDVDKFDKPLDDWRDPRITPLRAADIGELKIQREGALALHAVRDPTGWSFDDEFTPGFEADSGLLSDLVSSIARAEAQGYHLPPPPAGAPIFRVTLDGIARPVPEVLSIHEHDAEQFLVYRGDEPVGYLVARERLASLQQPAAVLRQRRVLDWKADDLVELSFVQSDGTSTYFTRQIGDDGQGAWSLAGHGSFERTALDRLLAHLLPLEAVSWDLNAAVGSDAIELHIGHTDGRNALLAVDPQTRNARLQGIDATMTVAGELAVALDAEFRDRQVLNIPLDQVAQVVVHRGEQSLTIRRELGQYVDGGGEPLDQNVAAGIVRTLANLRAQRYITAPDEQPLSQPRTFELHTADGQTRHVQVVAGDDDTPPAARVRGQWFTLSDADYAKLAAQ